MSVDQATVRHIAHLAHIAINDEDAKNLEGELNTILDWVEQLSEVNTDGVEPMTSAVHMAMKKRADVISDGGYVDKIVANAPATEDGFFMVPKVIE